jgi:hypothetical protein
MFEIGGKHLFSEIIEVVNDERVSCFSPRHHINEFSVLKVEKRIKIVKNDGKLEK